MASFFRAEDLDRRSALKEFLGRFYPGQSPSEYNLEDVLAFLDLARNRLRVWNFGTHADEVDAERLYREVIEYVRERLTLPAGATCRIHQRLFSYLDQTDTVITLNYDAIADGALRRLPVTDDELHVVDRVEKQSTLLGNVAFFGPTPPSLTPKERAGGHLLKLHGSLDWFTCVNPNCQNSNYVFVWQNGNESVKTAGAPCRLCGSGLTELIIPPVASKRTSDRGRVAFPWHLALRELMRAERLVIIGLSFAPTDFELKWLLRQALYLRPRVPLRLDL